MRKMLNLKKFYFFGALLCTVQLSILFFLSPTFFHSSVSTPLLYAYNRIKVLSQEARRPPASKIAKLTKQTRDFVINHRIFSDFYIPTEGPLKRVDILVVVSSAPSRYQRRKAIRETWWKQCKETTNVIPECIFLTDHQKTSSKYYLHTLEEAEQYKDLKFQNIEGGVNFGSRFLFHLVYALKVYHFDYFLRMDDDVFFCMATFLQSLHSFPKEKVHWGYMHCQENLTRADESILMFSYDMVEMFLHQDVRRLKCHPFADQMIAIWMLELNMNQILRHDLYIHHHPVVKEVPYLKKLKNICSHYIALHGSYSNEIRWFWKRKGPAKSYSIYQRLVSCPLGFSFNWRDFGYYTHEPRPCIEKPTWNTKRYIVRDGVYMGREKQSNASW